MFSCLGTRACSSGLYNEIVRLWWGGGEDGTTQQLVNDLSKALQRGTESESPTLPVTAQQ